MPVYIPPLFFRSRARAYRSANQSIPNNAATIIQWNVEQYDEQNEMDIVTPWRFTAKKAGVYSVKFTAHFDASATGIRIGYIFKNGGGHKQVYVFPGSTYACGVQVADDVKLAAGDYLDFRVYQNSGAALVIFGEADGVNTNVAIHKLSE